MRGAFAGLGVAVGVTGFAEAANVRDRKLPLLPDAQSATVSNLATDGGKGQLRVTWQGQSDAKLIALTFDDGPKPQWTPLVLDILDQHQVPATFFMVGKHVKQYGSVVQGRLDRHEVGNHTWEHIDLARRTQQEAYRDLVTAHEEIVRATGRTPTVFRPPYGHFGGSAVLAADRLDYEMILWSLQMQEENFPHNPTGHARHIASQVTPNTILLAHDIDADGRDRRVAIDGLPLLFELLRGQGYEFVTVSQMLSWAPGVQKA
jgi:peptidoglycan-N-acetylglucosamine deacetylase